MPEHEPIDYRLRCHTKRTDLPADVLRDIGEAYGIVRKVMDEEQLIERLDDILTKTANALHGDTPKNTLHSWHDLPERVERLRQERDEARREVCRGEARLRLQRHHAHKDSEEVVLKAKEISVERGWDCFKEDTND